MVENNQVYLLIKCINYCTVLRYLSISIFGYFIPLLHYISKTITVLFTPLHFSDRDDLVKYKAGKD